MNDNAKSLRILSGIFLIFLIVIFCIYSTYSCEKEDKATYLCKGTSIVSKPGYISDTIFNSFTKQNMTVEEIIIMEKINTNIITQVHEGFSYTITNKLVCAKLTCPEY